MWQKTLMVLAGILVSIVVVIAAIGWWLSAPAYSGPQADNFDGKNFHNRAGYVEKGLGELLKWALNREPGEWSELTEEDVEFGERPAARISGSSQVITYINHSTFLIQTDRLNIITDPVYSERVSPFTFAGPKRMRPPGIRFDELPDIDVVLISHNHYDHLDIATLKEIRDEHDPLFITPLGVDLYLHKHYITKTKSLNWWEETPVTDEVQIAAVEAQHFSSRGMFDRDKTLWAGFVIKSPNGNIYFAGDTGYNDFFKLIGERYAPVKTALIPVGAYRPRWFMGPVHVDPEEAIQVHREVGAELSIGMHFGTFPLADDGMDEPVNDFNEVVGDENFVLINNGQKIIR